MDQAHRLGEQPPEGRPGSAEPGAPAPGGRRVQPVRLAPLLPRRQDPWLLVDVDGSPASHGALVWALREAARREATVVAVCVLDHGGREDPQPSGGHPAAALEQLEAQVLAAVAETGVSGRVRTAVLERPVFEALTGAARGADLVVVSGRSKTLLRPAVPRTAPRRLARGA